MKKEEEQGRVSSNSSSDVLETRGSGEVAEKRVQKSKSLGFQLADRDWQIFEFLLEMKFASLDQIYQKFYWSKSSKSKRYAIRRIRLLKAKGFLEAHKIYTENKHYFQATALTYGLLRSRFLGRDFLKPLKQINVHSFEHDRRVLDGRIALETSRGAKDWLSERRLKISYLRGLDPKLKQLPMEFLPDALFSLPSGQRVAFELEHSRKSKARYEAKIYLFRRLMEEGSLFQKTLLVATSEASFQTLTKLTLAHGDYFRVLRWKELLPM